MKTASVIAIAVAVVALGFGIYMVDIDQTEEASMPDIDVAVEPGSMPEFEANVGVVDLGTEEVTLDVPTIDIQPPRDGDTNDS